MVNRKEIWNELKEISPLLAKLEPIEVFQVAPGYFDAFAADTLSLIRAGENPSSSGELNSISSLIGSAGKEQLFSVPAGYFEGLASGLLNKIHNKVKNPEPVSVDDELETLSPLLSKLERKSPFSVASDYFDKFPDNALAGSKEFGYKDEPFSPLLDSLKERNPFWIPAGYFEELSGEIMAKIISPKSARVISINSRFQWMRYAAAAVIIGAIATTSVFLFQNHGPVPRYMASLNEKQLADSLHNANEKDMMDYLQSHNLPVPDSSESLAQLGLESGDEMGGMLADISDSELQQYLDDYTGSKEQTIN